METHIARKEHRCDECGRRIPIGSKYFSNVAENRQHTNCLLYKDEPMLKIEFNMNRKAGAVTNTCSSDVDNFGRLKEFF